MKLHTTDLLIICAYLIAMIVIGLILKKRAAQNMDSYLRWKIIAFLYVGIIQRLRNVRYYGHNANGILGIRLWFQKSLDSLVMAGVQPDIPNGLLIRVAAPFERSHRCRMD